MERASVCYLTGITHKYMLSVCTPTRDYIVQLGMQSQWQAALLTGLKAEAGALLTSKDVLAAVRQQIWPKALAGGQPQK